MWAHSLRNIFSDTLEFRKYIIIKSMYNNSLLYKIPKYLELSSQNTLSSVITSTLSLVKRSPPLKFVSTKRRNCGATLTNGWIEPPRTQEIWSVKEYLKQWSSNAAKRREDEAKKTNFLILIFRPGIQGFIRAALFYFVRRKNRKIWRDRLQFVAFSLYQRIFNLSFHERYSTFRHSHHNQSIFLNQSV